MLFSKEAEADGNFLRDMLGFQSVGASHDWLIFALPPADNERPELYFLYYDLKAEFPALERKSFTCSEVQE